jgi:hypothetical protein
MRGFPRHSQKIGQDRQARSAKESLESENWRSQPRAIDGSPSVTIASNHALSVLLLRRAFVYRVHVGVCTGFGRPEASPADCLSFGSARTEQRANWLHATLVTRSATAAISISGRLRRSTCSNSARDLRVVAMKADYLVAESIRVAALGSS